jgi:hypothetical protein
MPLRFNVKRRISSVNISFFEIENWTIKVNFAKKKISIYY